MEIMAAVACAVIGTVACCWCRYLHEQINNLQKRNQAEEKARKIWQEELQKLVADYKALKVSHEELALRLTAIIMKR